MLNLEIDIETFSSVNLAKAGVYRYAESPDFEVLLFGYSVDGGEVKVGDLVKGEKIPEEVMSALDMGLPLSLEGVGAVLGLEKQKLTEGKDLILERQSQRTR